MKQPSISTYIYDTIINIDNCFVLMDNHQYNAIFNDTLNIASIHKYVNIGTSLQQDMTRQNLKDIRSFLKLATLLGLTGYCRFEI